MKSVFNEALDARLPVAPKPPAPPAGLPSGANELSNPLQAYMHQCCQQQGQAGSTQLPPPVFPPVPPQLFQGTSTGAQDQAGGQAKTGEAAQAQAGAKAQEAGQAQADGKAKEEIDASWIKLLAAELGHRVSFSGCTTKDSISQKILSKLPQDRELMKAINAVYHRAGRAKVPRANVDRIDGLFYIVG